MSLVHLAPFGTPPEEVLFSLATDLPGILGLRVFRLAPLAEPEEAFDAKRGQWSSAEMLRHLVRSLPAGRVLGVTERDLFVPVLSFVYGQAQLRGRVAIISLARLRQEFYDLPPEPELVAERALKESVHELGHTFGLVHCLDRGCPLSLSVSLSDLDTKSASPCPSCFALLEGSLA